LRDKREIEMVDFLMLKKRIKRDLIKNKGVEKKVLELKLIKTNYF